MALIDILGESGVKIKIGLSEERLRAIVPSMR